MRRLPIRKVLRNHFGENNYRVERTGSIYVFARRDANAANDEWFSLGNVNDPWTQAFIRELHRAQVSTDKNPPSDRKAG